MFLPVHTALPLAETGQIRILAVGQPEADARRRQVCRTLAELGVTDFDVDLWYGVLAPANTPKEIVDRYNAVFNEILAEPNVRALSRQARLDRARRPAAIAWQDLIAKDRPRWAKVVKVRRKITAE
jgi:tripartite-type tricarboxylate transporter receptor subunit TctC